MKHVNFGCREGLIWIAPKINKQLTNSSRGLSEGSRFFAKNAKIAPLLKAPDEGVIFKTYYKPMEREKNNA